MASGQALARGPLPTAAIADLSYCTDRDRGRGHFRSAFNGWIAEPQRHRRPSVAAAGSRILNATSRPSKPNDGHSIASDLATNAIGGVKVGAAGGPGDVAVALVDGCTAGLPRGAMPPTGHHLKALEGRAIHHRQDKPWRRKRRLISFFDRASQPP